jgi:predicted O-methyltransferase YrrM
MKKMHLYSRMASQYLQYYLAAKTKYDVHSPFVFQLLEEVIEDDRQYYAFEEVELMRRRMLNDQRTIRIKDQGAGSKVQADTERPVRQIAHYAAVSPAVGQLLFRLVLLQKPDTILELGTSLGISAAYQSSAARSATFITIEGCPNTAAIAQDNLQQFGYSHIHLRSGSFEDELPKALEQLQKLDYLYLDGDHRKAPSLRYFEQCLPYAHAQSVFVVGDIYWSDEMRDAWKQMQQHESVRLSVDLYHVGLLFFRNEQREKEHFTLIPAKYKPWRMGFF